MDLTEKDFIIYKDNNQIKSGGYSIKSILLNKDKAAMDSLNINTEQNGGGKVSDLFSNLAIPAGLLYISSNSNPLTYKIKDTEYHNVITDSIHDQLLELVISKEKSRYNIKTRRNKIGGRHKKTRRL